MNLNDLNKVSFSKHNSRNAKTIKQFKQDQLESGEAASEAIMNSLRYALEDVKNLYEKEDIFNLHDE